MVWTRVRCSLPLPIGINVDEKNEIIEIEAGSVAVGVLAVGDVILEIDGRAVGPPKGVGLAEAVDVSRSQHALVVKRQRPLLAILRGVCTTQRVLLLLVAFHAAFALSATFSSMPTLTALRYELWAYRGRPTRLKPVTPTPVVPAVPSTEGMDPEWGLKRIQAGEPIRIAAAGLSRSGSTWQFNALRLVLQHALEAYAPPHGLEAHSAHGHTMDEVQGCLTRSYCVVKVHEFMPDVLARVDAVFLTHRDPRGAGAARKISSCLAYGTQPLLSAFTHYASWLPYACFDMRYESMIAEGVAVTLRRHLRHLGLPANLSTLSLLTKRLHELTHKPKPTEADAVQTGMMPGHVTFVTTDPEAHDVFAEHVHTFSSYCNLTREVELIEHGWGRWLVAQGYEEAEGRFGSNEMLDTLPVTLAATLMAERASDWNTSRMQLGSRCPRLSRWSQLLNGSGIWAYSQLRVNRNRGGPHYNAEAEAAAKKDKERQAAQAARQKQPIGPQLPPSAGSLAVIHDGGGGGGGGGKGSGDGAKQAVNGGRPPRKLPMDAPGAADEASLANRRPHFYIFGSPRCGTTALHNMLHRHPLVMPATVKEINYFHSDAYFNKSRNWYRRLLAEPRDGRVSGDGSCTSMLCADTPGRLAAMFGEDASSVVAEIIAEITAPASALAAPATAPSTGAASFLELASSSAPATAPAAAAAAPAAACRDKHPLSWCKKVLTQCDRPAVRQACTRFCGACVGDGATTAGAVAAGAAPAAGGAAGGAPPLPLALPGAPAPLRLLLAVRDETARVLSHYEMCRRNGAPLQPISRQLAGELARVSACNGDAAYKDLPLVERFSSCIVRQHEVCHFGNALLDDEAVLQRRKPVKQYPGCSHLLAFSMYGAALHRWLQTPRLWARRVALVQMEAMNKHHERVSAAVYAFLGLPHHVDPAPQHTQESKAKPAPRADPLPEQIAATMATMFANHRAYLRNLRRRQVAGAEPPPRPTAPRPRRGARLWRARSPDAAGPLPCAQRAAREARRPRAAPPAPRWGASRPLSPRRLNAPLARNVTVIALRSFVEVDDPEDVAPPERRTPDDLRVRTPHRAVRQAYLFGL